MLVKKRRYEVQFAYRGREVIEVAADGIQEAIDTATAWFLEDRKPDMEWNIVLVKILSYSIIYDMGA